MMLNSFLVGLRGQAAMQAEIIRNSTRFKTTKGLLRTASAIARSLKSAMGQYQIFLTIRE
jgi:hypothetical protein